MDRCRLDDRECSNHESWFLLLVYVPLGRHRFAVGATSCSRSIGEVCPRIHTGSTRSATSRYWKDRIGNIRLYMCVDKTAINPSWAEGYLWYERWQSLMMVTKALRLCYEWSVQGSVDMKHDHDYQRHCGQLFEDGKAVWVKRDCRCEHSFLPRAKWLELEAAALPSSQPHLWYVLWVLVCKLLQVICGMYGVWLRAGVASKTLVCLGSR